MKRFVALFLCSVFFIPLFAQKDTTRIRIGPGALIVIEDGNGSSIKIDKEDREQRWPGRFNAHWAGLELGMNYYHQTDYSLYDRLNTVVPPDFMELNNGKSIAVNLNFAEFAFKNEVRNFGLVTGLGVSFMDFRFDQPYTIRKAEGSRIVLPEDLSDLEDFKKSKLHISYLTAPLMLEVKTPLRMKHSNLYIAAGVIGGLNIGSHTKYKFEDGKRKGNGNFYLNSFKYDLTGRLGFGDFCVFVNYGMVPLFKEGRGPELFPLTIGFSFPNL